MSKKPATGSKASARERLRAERARQAELERRRDRTVKIGIAAVVAVVVAAIGVGVWLSTDRTQGAPPAGVAWGAERGQGEPGMGEGVGSGDADAPVVLEVYEDFMCPACQSFEAGTADLVNTFVESGDVRVVRYPLTLSSFGQPSVLAANAYACAVDAGKGDAFHDHLFAQAAAPENAGGVQWTDDLLIEAGASVGLESETFRSCVEDGTFEDYAQSVEDVANERGVSQTPTVFVNGEEVRFSEGDIPAQVLRSRIEEELGGDTGSDDSPEPTEDQ